MLLLLLLLLLVGTLGLVVGMPLSTVRFLLALSRYIILLLSLPILGIMWSILHVEGSGLTGARGASKRKDVGD